MNDMVEIEVSDRVCFAFAQLAEITGRDVDDIAERLIMAVLDTPERHESEKPYSTERNALETRKRRFVQRALGFCVNSWWHGRAVRGGRCLRCWDRKIGKERKGASSGEHAGASA